MDLQKGWYWIEQTIEDSVLNYPAFFDGEGWRWKRHSGDHKVKNAIDPPQCQTGCTCTQNSDGSWTIQC